LGCRNQQTDRRDKAISQDRQDTIDAAITAYVACEMNDDLRTYRGNDLRHSVGVTDIGVPPTNTSGVTIHWEARDTMNDAATREQPPNHMLPNESACACD